MTRATLNKTFTQADFDAFAELSGDNNPIHVDPVFAGTTRFGKTVAHGALLCAVLRGVVEELVPGGRQLSQETMYPAPSPVGEPLQFSAEITAVQADTVQLDLMITRLNDQTITCRGKTELAR
ncbi:MaoC/PaaZ C-terminal domain-containing protein [Maricaulis sp. D1M11]|uniref:MaoC/PaaZ C-terminal domain-containing protein n=1 Tax=Maricaulis sp. D1M11 TaxID=3076117 RepID=UPI0039B644D1